MPLDPQNTAQIRDRGNRDVCEVERGQSRESLLGRQARHSRVHHDDA